MLTLVFAGGKEHSPLAYASYLLSAYTLAVSVLKIIRIVQSVKLRLHQNIFFHRYFTELGYKAQISLYLSFGVNLAYSVYHGLLSIFMQSMWCATMAFYYIILSTERFLLVRYFRGKTRSTALELRKYRFCGCLLLILTTAILAIRIGTMQKEGVIHYSGSVIYAAAGYTFYSLTLSFVNLVRYRRLDSPVCSAAGILSLSSALVSLLFLQTAMLETFSEDAAWELTMNAWLGFGVFFIVLALALFMILRGSIRLQKIRSPEVS